MFEVQRWLGPDDNTDVFANQKKNESLSLQQLNARARERAERRRYRAADSLAAKQGVSSCVTGKEVPAISSDFKTRDRVRIEYNEDMQPAPRASRKEKKRKERERTDEGEARKVEDIEKTEPHLDEKENGRKSKKRRVSQGSEDCKPNVEVQIELGNECHGTDVGGLTEIIPKETKRRKGEKKKNRSFPDSETQIARLVNNGIPDSIPTKEVDAFPPAFQNESISLNCQASGSKDDAIVHDLSEKANVASAGHIIKEKKKKKKRESSIEAQDNQVEVVDHLLDRSAFQADVVDEVPAVEFDLSQIERDVEKIIGHDHLSTKSASEGEHRKGPPVLPWMREPVEISSRKALPLNQVPGLDVRLQDALRNTGIETLFPVQVAVWHETIGPGQCERDLCVCSPTGSGKTLSYALPIVQKLSTRVLRQLRALVVLPTRDLAAQVKAVFDTIVPSVGLRVGLAVGQTSIAAEAAELVKFLRKMLHSFGDSQASDHDVAESCIDILVATPGRLMDHLRNTKGFTLQHLHYLVVDETDRLLRQSYQDWLPNVLDTVAATESRNNMFVAPGSVFERSHRSLHTIRHLGLERGMRGTIYPRLMKMVLSATLTRDPSKIAQLALHCPIYIAQSAVDNCYRLPEQLKSFKVVCKPGEKPLYLVALLQQLIGQQTIVFTASVVATHRLFILLNSFEGLSFKVVEYSSLQHQQARSKSLAKFRDGEVQVLVASDAMTRGMDVEGVGNVVNYDMPVYAKTYVHRVGRTARAGRPGCSYTLLRKAEVRYFKSLLKKVDNSSCKDYPVPASTTEELYERYLTALEKLKQVTNEQSAAPANKEGKLRVEEQKPTTGPDELFVHD